MTRRQKKFLVGVTYTVVVIGIIGFVVKSSYEGFVKWTDEELAPASQSRNN